MIINMSKTKELVIRRPNPRVRCYIDLCVIPGVESVREAKLLGAVFKDNLITDCHVSRVLCLPLYALQCVILVIVDLANKFSKFCLSRWSKKHSVLSGGFTQYG